MSRLTCTGGVRVWLSFAALVVVALGSACEPPDDKTRLPPRAAASREPSSPRPVGEGGGGAAGAGAPPSESGASLGGSEGQAGAGTAGAAGDANEAGAPGVFTCLPGELSVVSSEGCEQIAVCNATGDGVELVPCEDGDVVIRPDETAFRALHEGDLLDVSASAFATRGEYFDVTSRRHGTLIGQFLYEDFKALRFAYAATEPGPDTLSIRVGEQTATVQLLVLP